MHKRRAILHPAISRLIAIALLIVGFGCARRSPISIDPVTLVHPDLILLNAKVITVDGDFSIVQAVAIHEGKIMAVGDNEDVRRFAGPQTEIIDLHGRAVLPGLIDSHVHPGAAMTEFDHTIPEMESVEDVLDYIAKRAKVLGPGKWIQVRQVFITRLKDPRYPTRAELDKAAPENPVTFSTGPDASLNSLALKLSGIDANFKITDGGSGQVEKDAAGQPTGILRNLSRYVKYESPEPKPTEADTERRTLELFHDYNSVGLTSICDRDASPGAIERYARLRERGDLTIRLSASHHIDTIGTMDSILGRIKAVGEHPLHKPDPMLQIIGIKCYLDGGMLTGSAYMREPWGVSTVYGITDPNYRGVLFIPEARLLPIVRQCVNSKLQFTAHSVGDGAVHTLLNVYQQLDKEMPGQLAPTRPCITHSNFMSKEAVEMLPKLGVNVDIQPVWLWLDTRTLLGQFGYERLRWFQPLKSIFAAGGNAGGGSDHMQKIGSLRSVNPYNPFLGLYTCTTRNARWTDAPLHPEEALTREQALRFYTINNAKILFKDHLVGSLEAGKLADLIIVDHDPLTCSAEELRNMKVLRTYLGGKIVYDQLPQ